MGSPASMYLPRPSAALNSTRNNASTGLPSFLLFLPPAMPATALPPGGGAHSWLSGTETSRPGLSESTSSVTNSAPLPSVPFMPGWWGPGKRSRGHLRRHLYDPGPGAAQFPLRGFQNIPPGPRAHPRTPERRCFRDADHPVLIFEPRGLAEIKKTPWSASRTNSDAIQVPTG